MRLHVLRMSLPQRNVEAHARLHAANHKRVIDDT
jgi:hypothetical protein